VWKEIFNLVINADFVTAPLGRKTLCWDEEKELLSFADAIYRRAGHVRWISDSGAFEVSRVDLAVKCFTA